MTAQVEVLNLEQVQRRIRQMGQHSADLRPVFRGPITKSVLQFFRRQFDSEGKAGGERWADLRPATIRDKRRVSRSSMGILRRYGGLRSSFIRRSGPETYHRVTKHSLEHGSTSFKAALHQGGFTVSQWGGQEFRHARRVKPRRIVPKQMPRHTVRAWERTILDYIVKGRAA